MASVAAEKTEDDLRREIQELQRQHREITERLRDPRGIRRGAAAGGPRVNRGVVRPAPDSDDQRAPKRRLLSAVVKVNGEGSKEGDEEDNAGDEEGKEETTGAVSATMTEMRDRDTPRGASSQSNGGFRRDGSQRMRKTDYDMLPVEPQPRVFPKIEDPGLVKRNQRMLWQLVGTLEKFRQEDKQLSNSEAYMRRNDTLRRAEEKAREESERLRQHERQQIAEKRRRDLTLRARVTAKAEQKRLELLFIKWVEHRKSLSNFLRTKAEPRICYMLSQPLKDDVTITGQTMEQEFEEWKAARRAELSEFQKQIEEQYLSNVENQLERWQNARNARKTNDSANLHETMDKELETHRLEHGPKTRRIPGGGNDDDEDVEDMAADDELLDEVLGVNDRIEEDASKLLETADGTQDMQ